MNPTITAIQKIIDRPFNSITGQEGDPMSELMRYDEKMSKYALEGEQLIGLNLSNGGLDDAKWQDIVKLLEPTPLKALNLSDNQLTTFHLSGSFRGLQWLNVSDNTTLNDLTFEKGLPNLRELNAEGCCMTEIKLPSGFSAVQTIKLGHNELVKVTLQGNCPELQRIDLSHNKLAEFLLPVATTFERLESVSINKNPLSSTFEAAAKEGAAAFARFLRQLALQGIAESYEIKMLIVGEGESGKTTLWKFLQDPTHVPDSKQASTVGIGIREGWPFDHPDHPGTQFSANIWDFGGQEIQYMTHQFFLTRRSFYVLLADGRREVANFPYWLKAINLLGTESNADGKLPVLVVLNEKGNPISKMPYDPATVANDFPRLEVLKYEVDFGKQDTRLKSLPTFIQEILSRRFPHLPLKVPTQWGEARKELQRLRNEEKKNHLTAAEFAELCRSKGIEDAQQQSDLSHLLHDLGIILHYQQVRYLHDFIILNPEWAVNAVYELLRHKEVKEQNQGRFDLDLLTRIWSDCKYTAKEQDGLLSLMLKDGFEVCFQATESNKTIYIAPQLLPEFQPELDWTVEEVVLRFIYQYAFMPKGIIGRLIVRLHQHLESQDDKKVIWEKGMILDKNGCRALVREVTDSAETGLNQIRIEIIGKNRENCKYLLREICEQLDEIHSDSFPALKIEKQIPCICGVCKHSITPHFYNLTELEERKSTGKQTIECRFRPFETVNIEELLSGVLSPESGIVVGPKLPGPEGGSPGGIPEKPTPKKVMILISSPNNLNPLNFSAELKKIQDAHSSAKRRDEFEEPKIEPGIIATKFTKTVLAQKPHILHLTMHASSSLGLFFEDKDQQRHAVSAEKLRAYFEILSEDEYLPEVCILSACNSIEHAKAIQPFCNMVIGTQDFFPDTAACLYAEAFYEHLFNGTKVSAAHKAACLALADSGITFPDQLFSIQDIPVMLT